MSSAYTNIRQAKFSKLITWSVLLLFLFKICTHTGMILLCNHHAEPTPPTLAWHNFYTGSHFPLPLPFTQRDYYLLSGTPLTGRVRSNLSTLTQALRHGLLAATSFGVSASSSVRVVKFLFQVDIYCLLIELCACVQSCSPFVFNQLFLI